MAFVLVGIRAMRNEPALVAPKMKFIKRLTVSIRFGRVPFPSAARTRAYRFADVASPIPHQEIIRRPAGGAFDLNTQLSAVGRQFAHRIGELFIRRNLQSCRIEPDVVVLLVGTSPEIDVFSEFLT